MEHNLCHTHAYRTNLLRQKAPVADQSELIRVLKNEVEETGYD